MNKTVAALIGLVVCAGAGFGSAWMLKSAEVAEWRGQFNDEWKRSDRLLNDWSTEKGRADRCATALEEESERAKALENALMATPDVKP